jgi:hypothetical protein
MRRVVAISAGLAVAALLAVPVSSMGQVPTGDSVAGKGQARASTGPQTEETFDFSATSGPSGQNPSGYAIIDFVVFGSAHFHVEGRVTCLSVSGNQAVVGFELDPNLSNFPAVGAIIEVTDNGPPGSNPPDVFNSGPVSDPTSCTPRLISPTLDVFEGDVLVVDAPPLPTSTEQCKNGGWKQFGFKNQGACVSFVHGHGTS